MLMLTIALQVLTLMEFVFRRELPKRVNPFQDLFPAIRK